MLWFSHLPLERQEKFTKVQTSVHTTWLIGLRLELIPAAFPLTYLILPLFPFVVEKIHLPVSFVFLFVVLWFGCISYKKKTNEALREWKKETKNQNRQTSDRAIIREYTNRVDKETKNENGFSSWRCSNSKHVVGMKWRWENFTKPARIYTLFDVIL